MKQRGEGRVCGKRTGSATEWREGEIISCDFNMILRRRERGNLM